MRDDLFLSFWTRSQRNSKYKCSHSNFPQCIAEWASRMCLNSYEEVSQSVTAQNHSLINKMQNLERWKWKSVIQRLISLPKRITISCDNAVQSNSCQFQ